MLMRTAVCRGAGCEGSEVTGRPGLMKAYLAPVRRGRREESSVRTTASGRLCYYNGSAVQLEHSKMLMLNGKGTLEFLLGDLFLVTL